jgi:phosphate:Na+ symporter
LKTPRSFFCHSIKEKSPHKRNKRGLNTKTLLCLYPLAGLGLLFFGLRLLQTGLAGFSGRRFKTVFHSLSANPARAALTGLAASALTQSSTAVSVITTGLTHSRILNLEQAIAVILGANVGTTLTVQFLALNPGPLAVPLCLAGVLLAAARPALRALGAILTGSGLIFWGLDILNLGIGSLQEIPLFAAVLAAASENPLLAIGTATILTALIHSSAVTTGITMTLYNQNVVDLQTAVALVLGNNIGTCCTALIVSLTSSVAGRRVAVAHLLVNVLGALIFLPFLNPFSSIIAASTARPAQQVANAHILYNVISSLTLFPFCGRLARLLQRLLPDRAL